MGLVIVLVRRTSPATRTPMALLRRTARPARLAAGAGSGSARAVRRQQPRPRRGALAGRGRVRRQRAAVVPAGEPPAGARVRPRHHGVVPVVRGAAADALQPVPGAHDRPGRRSSSSPATSSWRAGSVSSPGALAALVVLPVVAFGGGVDALVTPTLLLVGIVDIAAHLLPVPRAPPDVARRPGPHEVPPGEARRGLTGCRAPSYFPSEQPLP